jgi:hypothetical protein
VPMSSALLCVQRALSRRLAASNLRTLASSSRIGPKKPPAGRQAPSVLPQTTSPGLDRAKRDPSVVSTARELEREASELPLSLRSKPGQRNVRKKPAAGNTEVALADLEAVGGKKRKAERRPENVEVVKNTLDSDMGIRREETVSGLAVGGDAESESKSQPRLTEVREGDSKLGVMYEVETDSEFDEAEWGSLETESRGAFDETTIEDASQHLHDISSVRSALEHKRLAMEGKAALMGVDPAAARSLVEAAEEPATTAPTTGRTRRESVSDMVRLSDPSAPVEVPIPGTHGRRRISLESTTPKLLLDPPTDVSVLPKTLPQAPPGTLWHWIPETSSAIPLPDGWNVAKGWGNMLGMPVLSVVLTPEDPLVLNEPRPVTRRAAHLQRELRQAQVASQLGLRGEDDSDSDEMVGRIVDALEQEAVRREATSQVEPGPIVIDTAGTVKSEEGAVEPPRVTAPDPSKHFLHIALSYRAYVGAFTCEALTSSEPEDLAKFFLTLAIKRFLPPAETVSTEEQVGAGQEALLGGESTASGGTPWTTAQLSAAIAAMESGQDPEQAARGVASVPGSGQTVADVGFSYAAFPHIDRPDAPVTPSFEDQWFYELVPGRVYGFGAIVTINWSPMSVDDPSHRLNGGMRYAISISMDSMTNVLHETVFRAPTRFWNEAWEAHGESMLDETCIAWRDDSLDKFA